MRAVIATLMLAMTVLGGCAEIDPNADAAGEPTMSADADNNGTAGDSVQELAGRFLVSFDNDTFTGPFNATLDYVGDDSTNLTQMAWTLEFTHIGNMSAEEYEFSQADPAAEDNATANDGNATAAAGNMTPVETTHNVTSFEGVGLPFVLDINLTEAGNYTVSGIAEFADAYAEMMPVELAIASGAAEIIGPCVGAAVQETISKSSTALPGVLGMGFFSVQTFVVAECQTGFTITLTPGTIGDFMIEFTAANGDTASVDSGSSGDPETFTYAPGGNLEAGTYAADVYSFLNAVDTWTMSIEFQ
jgi:hypothetical protein